MFCVKCSVTSWATQSSNLHNGIGSTGGYIFKGARLQIFRRPKTRFKNGGQFGSRDNASNLHLCTALEE